MHCLTSNECIHKMSFVIKDDVLDEIWNKIKKTLNIKFNSMPVHDERYITAKVREFNDVIKTNFLSDKIQKEMCTTPA